MCGKQNNGPPHTKNICVERETTMTCQIGIDPKAHLLASLKEKRSEPTLLQPNEGYIFKLSVVGIKK